MNDRSRTHRTNPPAFAPSIGLREVLEAAPDLVFSTDPWGRLVWASSAFETFTGRRVKDCVGMPCTALIAPAHVNAITRVFVELRDGRLAQADHELELVRADGSTLAVTLRLRFLDSASGDRYLVGVAREGAAGTASKLGELERHLAEARAAAQVKGDFLATMSHEIRTPMNGVIGMTQLLLQGELVPEQRRLVELIRSSSQTLLALINDTLDYSRLEAGRMPVETLDFDLRVALDQVAGILFPLAETKSIRFDSRVHELVPSRLQGDPGRIRQVLLNLGSNAIKFTDRGHVSVGVDREAEDDHEVTLRFRVQDTGPGIPEHALPALFEPYSQADSSVARQFGGTGLGLAISRRLVEAMGGEMGVDSASGKGSTFWFRLRLAKQPVTVGGSAAQPSEVPLRGLRVLVADGNAGDRDPLCDVLHAWGCEVERAENGPEALMQVREAAARQAPFAVAILDRHLELLDGEELGQAIRADQSLDDTRLVMVTNVGRPGDGGRVKAAGFSAYLMKPLDPGQLYEALGEVMHPAHADVNPAERPLVTRHSLAEARRGRLRLLLVDDDPVNQLVTTSALNRVGYHLEVANSGRRAIELTETERWDLILMDMQMPDLDGPRTTAAIRARERGAWRTPIIGLTANADHKPDRDRCLAAGMDLVLGKPINLAQLTQTVEKFTARDGRPVESEPAPNTPPKLTVVSSSFEAPATVSPAARANARPARPADVAPPEIPELPEGPAVDLEQLETACMGLPALRASLLHTFLADVPARLERLAQAFDSGDPRRLEFEAHGLKGMCATIGAGGCSMLFGEIEDYARQDRAAEARAFLEPSMLEVQRAQEFIQRFESIVSRGAA